MENTAELLNLLRMTNERIDLLSKRIERLENDKNKEEKDA